VTADSHPALATDDGVRAVYAAHGPELYRFAMRSLGDRGLAEEAVQETFVRAWRAAERFDDELGSLRTWLFAIVRNVVIDLSRARAVRPSLPATDRGADDALFVDEAFDRVLTAWQVEEALRMLSEEHRLALIEVHYKGRAYSDVALGLGVPVGTVKSRVYYALKPPPRWKSSDGPVTTDPCRDWQGVLGAAALGVIDPGDRHARTRRLCVVPGGVATSPQWRRRSPRHRNGPHHCAGGAVRALGGRSTGTVAPERTTRDASDTSGGSRPASALATIAAVIVGLVLVVSGPSTRPRRRREWPAHRACATPCSGRRARRRSA
jgi:RNA polymerase sigma-70 factor (ECF subfamily)